jgi:cytochrome d ubiquinol oxidase subunit II
MEIFWYGAVSLFLIFYVILDGYVFGAGMVYWYVARTDVERRIVLRTFGPVWHGNEVYLLAGGGLLFFAFPKAYSAGFSGFYLALMIVLWLFMLRGISIKVRSYSENPLWRSFWDAVFPCASFFLAIVFGAALGNLIRGVPLNGEGYFFTPFWTTFKPGPNPGILDWYTVLMGIVGAVILGVHGAHYLTLKTDGEISLRAHRVAEVGGWLVVPLTILAVAAIPLVQPALRQNYDANTWGYVFPTLALAALMGMLWYRRRQRDLLAFMASSIYIGSLLSSAVWGLFPNILIGTQDQAFSLTIYNASTSPYSMQVGLIWFCLGISLVLIYTVYVHWAFRGKVDPSTLGEDY